MEPTLERLIRDYALCFVGKPYLWGGDDPIHGFDCSGFVLEVLEAFGVGPKVDMSSQSLHDWLKIEGSPSTGAHFGGVAFFGKDTKSITHTALVLGHNLMIEAGGGNSQVIDEASASLKNAYIKIRPLHRRKDLVAVYMPDWFL